MRQNCRLSVDLFTLSGTVFNPATVAVYPNMTQIASFTAPIAYALVNAFMSCTLDTANDTGAVYLVLNDAPTLVVSRVVGIIASQVAVTTGVSVASLEKFIDFQNHGIIIPQGRQISLYASYQNFGARFYVSANLQLKAIE